jgi:lipopolysaccharide transport system ATP-binding protein
MSNIAIVVENLSKIYRLGSEKQSRDTIAGVISDWILSPINNYRRLRNLTKFEDESQDKLDSTIWALKDVSFNVKQGEVLGVIGRNGAGKSTLLKILSRITHPTSGIVSLNGRVASLLEVGTGFHPELTGRDNVFLNGTILGMTKKEIEKKFDQIVEFSGVSKFIDTPVKFYSSGMRVRLAFSVAAHLEPEILLIDEVLSVGDAAFQKRSLGKMEEVSRAGRTVLFVSHNMGAVRSLCSRAILIEEGIIKEEGPVDDVISAYLSNKDISTLGLKEWNLTDAPQCDELVVHRIKTISSMK